MSQPHSSDQSDEQRTQTNGNANANANTNVNTGQEKRAARQTATGSPSGDVSLQSLAEDEADKKLGNAEGTGRAERLQNAYKEAMSDLRSNQQQQQQAVERYEGERRKLRDIGRTIRKFRRVGESPDIEVRRDYPGGFSFTVPPGERESCLQDLHEEVGDLRTRIQAADRARKQLSRQNELIKATLRELESRARAQHGGNQRQDTDRRPPVETAENPHE